MMKKQIPQITETIPEFMEIIHKLVAAYERAELASWGQAHTAVTQSFTPAIMAEIEAHIPGWQRMAGYDNGQTLVHVCSVFVSLFRSDFYAQATPEVRCLWEWVVLLHDLDKIVQKGKRDRTHAFRSTVLAAQILPQVGFTVLVAYEEVVVDWARLTATAVLPTIDEDIQDNSKLPQILNGIEGMFGTETEATLILKAILFHHSFSPVAAWPNPATLTNTEIKAYVTPRLWQFLGPFLLFDSDAWDMYFGEETRQKHAAEMGDCLASVNKLLQAGRP